MEGAVDPTSIAISVSIGASLLGVLISLFVAMGSRDGARSRRDVAVAVLFGIAVLSIASTGIAAAFIAIGGLAYVGVLKAALLLVAAFAVISMAFGLMRGLRSGRAIGTHSA